MKQKLEKWHCSGTLARNFLIGGMVLILIVSGIVTFYHQWLTANYTETLYYDKALVAADLAANLGEKYQIKKYAGGGAEDSSYAELLNKLDIICQKTDILYIYFDIPDKATNGLEHVLAASDTAIPRGHHYSKTVETDEPDVMTNYEAMLRVYEGLSTNERVYLSNDSGYVMTAFVPVYQDGAIVAVAGVDIAMDTILSSVHTNTLIIGGGIVAIFAVFILIYLIFIRRTIIRPMESLSNEMTHFISADNLSRNDEPSTIKATGEIAGMVGAFNSMKADIQHYAKNLATAAAEQERLHTELALAAEIQLSNVPGPFPPQDDVAIEAFLKPAKEVGGDFYDYFMLDDDHLVMVMADVAGKGIPAALFTMKTKTLLSDASVILWDPAAIMARANNVLCEQNDACIFVTAFLGILTLSTGHLAFTNGGHTLPVLCGRSGCRLMEIDSDFVLGAVAGADYATQSMTLEPGDRLFLYTDGVTEAFSPDDELFGEKRMVDALAASASLTAREALDNLHAAITAFAAGTEQSDDLTMMAVDYRRSAKAGGPDPGGGAAEASAPKTLTLPADIRRLEEVKAFAAASLPDGADEMAGAQIELITEEIFTNICSYAYAAEDAEAKPAVEQTVTLTCQAQGDSLTLIFEDNGQPFDPLATAGPDLDAPALDRPVGGLGIFLTRELADDIRYDRDGDQNRLTIEKKWEHSNPLS